MTPVGFNGGAYPSPFSGLRPEMPLRKPSGDPSGAPDFPSVPVGAPNQAQPQFDNVLGSFIKEVNAKQMVAGDKVSGLLSGQNVPLHEAMVSMEEASVSFQLMVEVRNKLLDGYQELMRMQV
jgi:flagellar hook-basal body complex protein FliE